MSLSAREFIVPIEFEDLSRPHSDRFHLDAEKYLDIAKGTGNEPHDFLDSLTTNVSNISIKNELLDAGNIERDFILLYCFIRDFRQVPNEAKIRLFDVLCTQVLSYQTHFVLENGLKKPLEMRNAFKVSIYLLISAAMRAESAYTSKKRNEILEKLPKKSHRKKVLLNGEEVNSSYNWEVIREKVLKTLVSSLNVDPQSLWNFGVPDQEFSNLFIHLSFKVLEDPAAVRSKASRFPLFDLILLPYTAVSGLSTTVCTIVLQLVRECEHVISFMVDLCVHCSEKYGNKKLTVDIIREISRMNVVEASRNIAGLRNTSNFLSELSACLPLYILENMPLLLPLLRYEPYVLRSSIVSCISSILSACCNVTKYKESSVEKKEMNGDSNETSRNNILKLGTDTRDSFLSILEERAGWDCSSYTRAAALRAWLDLCNNGAIPLKKYPMITALASDRIRDKSAIVRRVSAQLISALLNNNPYGMILDPEYHKEKLSELATSEDASEETENATLKHTRTYHESALAFAASFSSAIPRVHELLQSCCIGDVIEGLKLLVQAYKFNLPGAAEVLQHSLSLIWHTDTSVRDEILTSFQSTFLMKNGASCSAQTIAHNLIVMIAQSSRSDLISLEEIIINLIKLKAIKFEVTDLLWEAVEAKKQQGWAHASALRVIAMAISSDSDWKFDSSKLKTLSSLSKSFLDSKDWQSFQSVCILLFKSPPVYGLDEETAMNQCMQHIIQFLKDPFCDESLRSTKQAAGNWFSTAEAALGALFRHSSKPEIVSGNIIRDITSRIFFPPASKESQMVTALSLSKLCFILGHSALLLLVYMEQLAARLKIARAHQLSNSSDRSSVDNSHSKPGNDCDDELGMVAEQDAADEKLITTITEKEIVARNLLGIFGPLLARIVANDEGLYGHHPLLRTAAVLALSKYMCVSGTLCERYLPLLFTVLSDESSHEAMKSTIVVALGDLAFRFPNALEPFNSHMFQKLKDESLPVRANALLVLTHLILNDMIKIKGLISDMALCLRDPVEKIRIMAQLCFVELSKRSNNPIYNLLPDIISRLSKEKELGTEGFREIMGFLIDFIKKDKHTEGLLEKLCARISASSEETQQRRDLAFCLAQLQISEKGLKRLTETVSTYKDAIGDPEVYGHFLALAQKAKRFAKPELKLLVDEWESNMKSLHGGKAEHEEMAKRATVSISLAKGRRRKRRLTSIEATASLPSVPLEEETRLDAEPVVREQHCTKRKQAKLKRGRRRRTSSESEKEEEKKSDYIESEKENNTVPRQKLKKLRKVRRENEDE